MCWPRRVRAVTVVGSWLLLPAAVRPLLRRRLLHPEPDGGLEFPGGDGFEPDHTDFLYFAFTIAVTAQTSDVAVSTRPMRRLVLPTRSCRSRSTPRSWRSRSTPRPASSEPGREPDRVTPV
jgi:uncharacterized membrane protein